MLTERVPLVSAVVDTVRRHPALLAQTALTLDHLSKGRFILGLGSGESENTVPYGFDFARPVSRFEEALRVIRLLWDTDGPVDFDGEFYCCTGPAWTPSPTTTGCRRSGSAPAAPDARHRRPVRRRMVAGRGVDTEHYAEMLGAVRVSAERAGRDPMAITPASSRCA